MFLLVAAAAAVAASAGGGGGLGYGAPENQRPTTCTEHVAAGGGELARAADLEGPAEDSP